MKTIKIIVVLCGFLTIFAGCAAGSPNQGSAAAPSPAASNGQLETHVLAAHLTGYVDDSVDAVASATPRNALSSVLRFLCDERREDGRDSIYPCNDDEIGFLFFLTNPGKSIILFTWKVRRYMQTASCGYALAYMDQSRAASYSV